METLGKKLKELRESLGLMQKAVAKEIGISNKVLSHYENDVRLPDLHTFILLCKFYNISADVLLKIKNTEIITEINLPDDDKRILNYYNRLNDDYKDSAKGHLVDLYREQQSLSSEKSRKSIS
jgi:transcriptional regulator with XRE-family HTH domain